MWKLIRNKDIPVVSYKCDLPSMSFAVFGDAVKQTPLLILPTDFLYQVSTDPVSQLGIMAYMASQVKDYYSGKVGKDNSDVIDRRARAYEAETLLTIQTMAHQEGVELEFNSFQQALLVENPQGLQSLPVGLFYPTPHYVQPIGTGQYN